MTETPFQVRLQPQPAALPFRAGLDGGGTGTRALLQDRAGRVLGQGTAGPSSLSQGVPQAWKHMQQALSSAFDAAGLPTPPPHDVALAVGVAGGGVHSLCAEFRAQNPGYVLCLLENDGVTQLAGAHGGGAGLVVSAGTGTVAGVRLPGGALRHAGGWGWPIGDEGGGAWLGMQAVRAWHQVLDGRAAPSVLSAVVAAVVGADATAVLHWCEHAGQNNYAQLAPPVFQAAEADCPLADELLDDAAHELARLVAALDVNGDTAHLPIVLNGSVGLRLASRWPAALQARLVEPQGDSAAGALRLLNALLDASLHQPADAAGSNPTTFSAGRSA